MNIDNHIEAFVRSFVQKHKKERWITLLNRNNEKTLHQSHKILQHLNPKKMQRDDELALLDSLDIEGVFLNIGRDEPYIANLNDIISEDIWGDCIFSIEEGKKALFLFHEGEKYLLTNTVEMVEEKIK